jgi:hypothetical protein
MALKLNGTHQPLFYANDINVWAELYILYRKKQALLVGSMETGLEGNADTSKDMVMSRDENTERSHNIKIDNISFKTAEECKYLRRI